MIGRSDLVASLFFSLLLLSSPVLAGEWVPAGSEQPGFRIMDVAVSGDGTYSALAGDAGIVLLTADGTECWRSPEGSYHSVSLSGNGSILAAGGDGIRVLHKNSTVLATIRSRNFVNDVAVTMDGSRIAAAADDETLRLYTSAGELVWSTKTDDDLVSVAISPNGTYIAGGTSAGNVLLFSAEGEERWTYGLSRQPVTSVAVADNARTIAAVSEDGAFSLISRAGSLLQSGSAPHAGGVSVTADGACAAVADRQGIRFIERDGTMKNHIKGVDASVAAAMDGDGMLIAVTDGARISGFMWNSGAAPEEAESTAGAIDNEPNAPAAAVTSTPEEAPVSTHSPFPLVPAIAGLFFSAGLPAVGRRFRE
ncbi:WD40 repeat domain-containing protein [Methanogenium cariaci]